MKCPCCGNGGGAPTTYAFEGLTVDLGRGLLICDDKVLRATRRQLLFLHEIASAWPGRCPRSRLQLIIEDLSTKEILVSNNLTVHISRLRSLLQDVGLGIETFTRTHDNKDGFQLNRKAGMRTCREWTEADRLAIIEERNKGKSWKDIGKMFSVDGPAARGVALHAAKRLGLPILRGKRIYSEGAKPFVRRESGRTKGR
jgi:DNA-binding winged helix-turn-helix (wHTH) protein